MRKGGQARTPCVHQVDIGLWGPTGAERQPSAIIRNRRNAIRNRPVTATTNDSRAPAHGHAARTSFGTLLLTGIGVVFGDIGTSPLYAVKEAFSGPHALPVDKPHVLGILSLIFWTVLLVVSVKYLLIIMRADNRGEGGSLSLLALLQGGMAADAPRAALVGGLGIFAGAMFFGDAAITPAISVLSAVEGLSVLNPALDGWVVPIVIAILFALFHVQARGTAALGGLFGVIMLIWFLVLGALGIAAIKAHPGVLAALSPHYAIGFILNDGWIGFLALGSVVLAVTGAEALYADMGHVGKAPIRTGWYVLVWPALILNYLGQGALLLKDPATAANPFYNMAPAWGGMPLLILATMASIIASQAVITGAFSVTRQAVQLGYLPRMAVRHTSETERGQIYMPFVNWTLMLAVIGLVLTFRESTNLAAAYGVAVTGTMLITTILVAILANRRWGWSGFWFKAFFGLMLAVDLAYFLATMTKVTHGGWFPLAAGACMFVILTTWRRGRDLVAERRRSDAVPIETVLSGASTRVLRVPGTAVFLCSRAEGVPHALLHNLKHNKVLHERVVLLTVEVDESPRVCGETRLRSERLRDDLFRVVIRFGFMENPDIPKALANARLKDLGFDYEPMAISYFLTRETVIPSRNPGMEPWREKLFAFMSRTATTTADFFHLPLNRVVELGGTVEI